MFLYYVMFYEATYKLFVEKYMSLYNFFMQYFLRYVTKMYPWWNQKTIEIIDCDKRDRYYGEVYSVKRKNKVVNMEKFIVGTSTRRRRGSVEETRWVLQFVIPLTIYLCVF